MKRVLSILVALTLCFTSTAIAEANDLTDAQKEYNETQKSIQDKKEALENITKKKEATEDSVEKLDEQMEASEKALNELNSKLNTLNIQTNSLVKQIDETSRNLKEQNELFKTRIRAMYISGNEGYLQILFNAHGFADLIGRIEALARVMEYDKKLINGIEENKKTLQQKQTEVAKVRNETNALKTQADSKLKALEATTEKKKEIIESLEKDEVSFRRMIDKEEKEAQDITNLIKRLKKEKEEKEKAEQNNSNNNNSSNNNNNNNNNSNTSGKLYCVTGGKYPITSPFGPRKHPIYGVMKPHKGIDIGISYKPLYSLKDGEVIFSGTMNGYGRVVMIDHGNISTVYAHLSESYVKKGQQVKGGQKIAKSGNTGDSTGPHLHFEVRNASGTPINPSSYYVH